MARFAINGFGRIGRNILRAALKRRANLDVVLINDIDKPKTLAHLFKYDSVHGIFEGKIEATEDAIVVNGKRIAVTAKRVFRRVDFERGFVRLLPAVSALVVLGLGLAMTLRALPKVT